jgi:hypothetical protein
MHFTGTMLLVSQTRNAANATFPSTEIYAGILCLNLIVAWNENVFATP